jgi:hypothetical protein
MPLLPSGKSSRAQLQVASIPGEAPKPRRRSSRTAPAGDNRPPSCAIWRRPGSAGPIVFLANAATLAAPSTRAPTALAHNTCAPSVDHSHAGSWLVAWTESLGWARPCNWNSLVLMMMIGQAAQFVVFLGRIGSLHGGLVSSLRKAGPLSGCGVAINIIASGLALDDNLNSRAVSALRCCKTRAGFADRTGA